MTCKKNITPAGPGLHEYQVCTSHNTYQVPEQMKNKTPEEIIESYLKTYSPHGFEFDIYEENGNYIIKHFNFEPNKYDFKSWLEAIRNNLEKGSDPGPYHIYIELKSIKDTRKFPEKFDQIIQSVFQNSKIHVFTQKDYQNNGNKFPEPAAMQNMIMFQISGSAGETRFLKPFCTVFYYICQRFCSLFSAKKNYDKWENENKLAFPDITGYNFCAYKHRAFINFPTFMITNMVKDQILEQESQGKMVRTFIADEKFINSPEGRIPNLLTIQIDPTKPPVKPLASWMHK
jgi:hypothetical protein